MPEYIHTGHPLDGPRLKIIRAYEHLEAFEHGLNAFVTPTPYRMVGQLDADEAFYVYHIEQSKPMPLSSWMDASEAVTSLRHALDHLAWQLAIVGVRERGETREPFDRTEFPIHWREPFADWKVRDLPDRAVEIIKSLQPYHRGEAAKRELLWMLHELDIVDKHRLLNFPTAVVESSDTLDARVQWHAGSLENGDVFARVPADIDVEKDFHPHIKIVVAFPQAGPAGGFTYRILRRIHDYVAFDVLPRFSGFFPEKPWDLRELAHLPPPNDGDSH